MGARGMIPDGMVIGEDDALDAEDAVSLVDLGFAAEGEGAAGFAPVADVAVGHGHEEHVVAGGGPARGGAADLEFAIIRVRAEGDDAEFAVVGGRQGDAGDRGAESGGEGEGEDEREEGAERGGGAGVVPGDGGEHGD